MEQTRSLGRLLALGVVACLALTCSRSARAQPTDQEPTEASADRPPRIFGAGTALGGGVGAYSVAGPTGSTDSGLLPAIMLPTLEIQGFLPDEYSIDVSVPLTNMIVVAAITDIFVWQSDFFFNFNFGDGMARGVVGPGLGFAVGTVSGATAGSIRLPAELGLELLSGQSGFGFKVMARPWAEFAFAQGSGSTASGVGGGILGLLAFSGYVTD